MSFPNEIRSLPNDTTNGIAAINVALASGALVLHGSWTVYNKDTGVTYNLGGLGAARQFSAGGTSTPAGALTAQQVAAAQRVYSGGNANGLVWRPSTLAAIGATSSPDNGLGDAGGTRSVTDFNIVQSIQFRRSTGRLRFFMWTGPNGTMSDSFKISGFLQVKGVNGGATQQRPVRINGQRVYTFPAGGGHFAYGEVDWKFVKGDVCKLKLWGRAASSDDTTSFPAFLCPLFNSPVSNMGIIAPGFIPGNGAATDFESNRENLNADYSQTLAPQDGANGTTPWTSSNFTSGMFRAFCFESDCRSLGDLPTWDQWGDSIGAGGALGGRPAFLNQIAYAAGVVYNNMCVPSTSQNQTPLYAYGRIRIARADCAICQHGRNSNDTAALMEHWILLRSLGYRKIIQTTQTNQTNTGNTGVTSNSQPIRAFVVSSFLARKAAIAAGAAVIPEGPDVVWDVAASLQDVGAMGANTGTGLWLNAGTFDSAGLHPNDAGNDQVYAYAVANGWLADLQS